MSIVQFIECSSKLFILTLHLIRINSCTDMTGNLPPPIELSSFVDWLDYVTPFVGAGWSVTAPAYLLLVLVVVTG